MKPKRRSNHGKVFIRLQKPIRLTPGQLRQQIRVSNVRMAQLLDVGENTWLHAIKNEGQMKTWMKDNHLNMLKMKDMETFLSYPAIGEKGIPPH